MGLWFKVQIARASSHAHGTQCKFTMHCQVLLTRSNFFGSVKPGNRSCYSSLASFLDSLGLRVLPNRARSFVSGLGFRGSGV